MVQKKKSMRRIGAILSVIVVFFVAFVRHSVKTGSCEKVKTKSCQESAPKPAVEEAHTDVVIQESSPKSAVEEADTNTSIVVKEISQESSLKQEDDSSDTDWNYESESEEELMMQLDWIGNF